MLSCQITFRKEQKAVDENRRICKIVVVLAVIAFGKGNAEQAVALAEFIEQLGTAKRHCALLVADRQTPYAHYVAVKRICDRAFGAARFLMMPRAPAGKPAPTQTLRQLAEAYILRNWKQPWVYLEPDNFPLRADWLEQLALLPANAGTLAVVPSPDIIGQASPEQKAIEQVRKDLGMDNDLHAFNLVFAPCRKDVHLLKLNLEWMHELDGQHDFSAYLVYDASIPLVELHRVGELGRKAFAVWKQWEYPPPRKPGWPQAPNWAFQHTARYMKTLKRSWFWYEPDAWPLKAGWLNVIEDEYRKCGKPIMGPIVPGMGHMNGVAIYPYNFCDISRLAMTCTDTAWDAISKPDIQGKVHDALHLMAHFWGLGVGCFTYFDGIGSPTFPDEKRLAWIPGTAVMVHRVKDNTLVAQLRKIRQCQKANS